MACEGISLPHPDPGQSRRIQKDPEISNGQLKPSWS